MRLARATAVCDPAPDDAALESIIGLVRDRTGIDFASYRRATIARRTVNRMIRWLADVRALFTHPAFAGA